MNVRVTKKRKKEGRSVSFVSQWGEKELDGGQRGKVEET
jgi:hypothetical protein